MPEQEPKSSQFWNAFGKISAVLVAIWLVLQIWGWLTAPSSKILATCTFSDFVLPKTYSIDKPYDAPLKQIDSFAAFKVLNAGQRELKDLKLELPVEGHYELYSASESGRYLQKDLVKQGEFEDSIDLGMLRSTHYFVILVWSETDIDETDVAKMKVSHPDGCTYVSLEWETTSWGVWEQRHFLLNMIIFVGGTGILMYIVYFAIVGVHGTFFASSGGDSQQQDQQQPDALQSSTDQQADDASSSDLRDLEL